AGHGGVAVSGAWAAASIPAGGTRARARVAAALHRTSPLTLAEKSLYNPASLKSGAAPSRPGFFWNAWHKAGVTALAPAKTQQRVLEGSLHADDQPTGAEGTHEPGDQEQGPRARPLAAEARRVHARLHDDAEEAELGAAQGGEGAAHQRLRGDQLHRRRGAQPAGALGRA